MRRPARRFPIARFGVTFAMASFATLGACRKGGLSLPSFPPDDPTEHPAPEVLDAGPPPRCTGAAASAGVVAEGASEVGLAVPSEKGVLLPVARLVGGKRTASVVWANDEGTVLGSFDVGPLANDVPAPRLAVRDRTAFVAFQTPSPKGARLEAVRVSLEAERGSPRSLASYPDGIDDSAGFDLRATKDGALLVWDDTPLGKAASVIMLASLREGAVDAGAPTATVVSPPDGDAEAPRLYTRSGGHWLLWLAARVDEPEAGVGSNLETPAEARRVRWVEALALDESGQPKGAPRAITSQRGHVRDFDAVDRDGALHVFVHDEAEAREGAGGKVSRVVLRSGPGAPEVLVANDVGGATIDIVRAREGGAWLSFLDVNDKPKLFPLNGELGTVGPASRELALDGARPVYVGAGSKLLAAGGGNGPPGQLRTWVCRP